MLSGIRGVKRLRLHIHGKVQGVYFRESTREQADLLGVRGWVRNEPDGTVAAVLEGNAAAVDALVDWCRRGPPRARVESLEAVALPLDGEALGPFEVRR